MIDTLFGEYIDKVFVFLRSDESISFVLPWINFDYIYLTFVIMATISFVFEVFCIFVSHWRDHK